MHRSRARAARPLRSAGVPDRHEGLGTSIKPPFPEGFQQAVFGLGCFWGAERISRRRRRGDHAVGYAAGHTPTRPTSKSAARARSHRGLLAVFDPNATTFEEMLRLSWEGHDPTQGMRQGNDVGTRTAGYPLLDERRRRPGSLARMFQERLTEKGYGDITTRSPARRLRRRRGLPPAVPAKNPTATAAWAGPASRPIGVARLSCSTCATALARLRSGNLATCHSARPPDRACERRSDLPCATADGRGQDGHAGRGRQLHRRGGVVHERPVQGAVHGHDQLGRRVRPDRRDGCGQQRRAGRRPTPAPSARRHVGVAGDDDLGYLAGS